MTAVVGSVAIDLQAQLARFESDMGRAARIAEKNMQQMERTVNAQLGKINRQMEGFSSTVKSIFAGVSVGTFGTFLKGLVDVADHINDLSKQFGISTTALSVWRLSAEKSGTSLDGIAKGAKVLTKDLADTESKLKSMGISLRDSTGAVKPMEKVMEEIAKKFAGYKEGAEKAAAASALFGSKIGPELIPFLDDFGRNVDAQRQRAEAFGTVIGPGLAQAADDFNDNMRDMKSIAEGFGNGVLNVVLPALNKFMGAQIDEAEASKGMVSQGEKVGEWLKDFAVGVIIAKNAVDVLVDGVKFFGTAAVTVFELAGKQATAFADYMSTASTALLDVTGNPIERAKALAGAVDKLWADLKGNAAGALDSLSRDAEDFGAKLDANISDVTDAFESFAPSVKASAAAMDQADRQAQQLAPHIEDVSERTKKATEADKLRREEEAHLLLIMKEGVAAHKALNKVLDDYAKTQDKVRKAIEQRHEIEDRNIRLAAMDEDARRRAENAIAAMAAATENYNAALKAGLPFTEEMLASEIALTEAKLNDADATEKLAEANKRAAQEVARDWQSATDTMMGALADFFTGAEGGLDRLVDSFARAGRQLASSALTRAMQGGSSANVWGLQGTTPGARLTGFVGGVANVYQGYRSGNVWQGVMGGAQAGAQYGGITGAVIGAVVGGILAAFRGKPKPPEIQVAGVQGQIDRIEASDTTAFGAVRVNTVGSGQMPSTEVLNAIKQFDQAIAQFMTSDQIAAASARLASFEIDLKKGAATIDNVLGQRFDAILSSFPEDIQTIVRGAGDLQAQVEKLGEVLQFPAQLAELMAALSEGDMLAGLSQFEQQVYALNKEFDAYADQADALGATQEQLAQIEVYRTSALQRLADAQVDLSQVEDEAAQQLIRNRQDLNALLGDVMWDDYIGGLSDFDRQMAELHKHFREVYEQAVSLGAGERELNVIREAERRAVERLTDTVEELVEAIDPRGSIYQILDPMEDAANALASALQRVAQYLLGLRTSEQFSPLTPQQRLAEAQSQFNAMLARARSGDVDAIGSLPQFAQTLLEQASAFWASGSQYDAIFAQVSDALQDITQAFGRNSTDPFVRMANALELHLPSIDAYLAQIAASPAAMPSYDSGTDFVPYDQVAKIHRGEAVLTASENRARRSGASVQAMPELRDIAIALREIAQQSKVGKSDASDKLGRAASALEKIAAQKDRQGK